MTNKVKRLVESLREHAKRIKGADILSADLNAAAELIEKLSADRDTWKRCAEAAERDMGYMVPCCTCKVRPIGGAQECNACSANILDGLKRSHYTWRGPCKENEGGAAN